MELGPGTDLGFYSTLFLNDLFGINSGISLFSNIFTASKTFNKTLVPIVQKSRISHWKSYSDIADFLLKILYCNFSQLSLIQIKNQLKITDSMICFFLNWSFLSKLPTTPWTFSHIECFLLDK